MKAQILGAEPGERDYSEEKALAPIEVSEVRLKTIVLAVDFSEASRRALDYAVTLAKKLQAEIILVHVFEGVPGELKILEASFVESSFQEEARASLSDWRRKLSSMGVAVKAVFRMNTTIAREIVAVATDWNADLIVIGNHAGGSLFVRNTVRKVLGHAPCPVLVGP